MAIPRRSWLTLFRPVLYLGLLFVLIACSNSSPSNPADQSQLSAAEISALKLALATQQREYQSLKEQLEHARERERQLTARVSQLESQLQALDQARAQLDTSNADRQRLTQSLERERQRANAAHEESRRLKKDLDRMHEQFSTSSAGSDTSVEAPGGETQPTGGATNQAEGSVSDTRTHQLVVEQTDTAKATEIELFYGTNRARTSYSGADYLKPLWLPLALAVLYLAAVALVRKIVKTRYQKNAAIVLAVALGLAFVYFLIGGVQKILQMRQALSLNPVIYGGNRLSVAPGEQPFELGTCTVSIPPVHKRSMVELPKLTHFEFQFDPDKHFVLSDITPGDTDEFYQKLSSKVRESERQDLFVFVHGFHNTFRDAAFRTAQIAHDLECKGAPVFFSWPSQGAVLDYAADENNVKIAVFDLKLFLEQLRERSQAKRIHLIAHSMGSRALSRAIAEMGKSLEHNKPLFNEMILAAPDIDAQVLDRLAEDITGTVDRLTLYASSKDEALSASRFVHGQTYQRAGETTPVPLVNPLFETIDVSRVTTGHSYIAGSGHILSDLNNILSTSRELNERIARKVPVTGGAYWVLRDGVSE